MLLLYCSYVPSEYVVDPEEYLALELTSTLMKGRMVIANAEDSCPGLHD